MNRQEKISLRRHELVPTLARTFAELGYRRTTTAELAKRCGVQENILYRLWPDKKKMFLAAIEYVYQLSNETWEGLLGSDEDETSAAERILKYESRHQGELGLYRIVFAGLSETDDPEIQATLQGMYKKFHRFIQAQIADHRGKNRRGPLSDAELSAWAIIGLGTVANISQELRLLSDRQRKKLITTIGTLLIEGRA